MTYPIHASERADRAVIGAFLLLLGTAGAAIASNPYTDYIPNDRASALIGTTSVLQAPPVKMAVVNTSPTEAAMVQLLAERRCLAEAMYYEARGEGVSGQKAIAEVIFNRMRGGGFPATICGVVYEGAQLKHACQFSFTCDGELLRPKSPHAWAEAKLLAAKILVGAVQLGDITDDATSFHATDVQPDWAGQMLKTVQIGNHVFYRETPRSRAS
jgi:spore germination cell wall hydrolase CwlJ-like protein